MGKLREIYVQMDEFLDGTARNSALVAFWLCISPVMLLIPKGITTIKNQQALNNPLVTAVTSCQVTSRWQVKRGEEGGCIFTVAGLTYSSTGMLGFGNDPASMPNVVRIKYLRANPNINEFGGHFGDYRVDFFPLLGGCVGGVIWLLVGWGVVSVIRNENKFRKVMAERLARSQGEFR
jgi:hypothetical protein